MKNPIQNSTNADTAAGQHLKAFGFDVQELQMLALCRRLFEAMSGPERGVWSSARSLAEAQHGAAAAERIMTLTIDVINAMRTLRSSPFTYGREGCACCCNLLTQEERLLIATFHNLRRRKKSRAYVQAMLLTEGRDPARLLVALEMLDFALFELKTAD
jgi:hypothetical protein